jgi:hypothetical protein
MKRNYLSMSVKSLTLIVLIMVSAGIFLELFSQAIIQNSENTFPVNDPFTLSLLFGGISGIFVSFLTAIDQKHKLVLILNMIVILESLVLIIYSLVNNLIYQILIGFIPLIFSMIGYSLIISEMEFFKQN